MLFILLQLDLFRKVIGDAVHPGSHIAGFLRVLKDLDVLALSGAHHWGQHLDAGALGQLHDLVHDLVDGLLADLFAAFGAVGHAHPGPEQAEIVINFRHGAHGGAGVFGGGFLVDGDGGREALDIVHVRLVHLSQEHSGVGAEAFHIAALPLGINGVKGQAGLAAAGKTGDYHQLVSGNLQIDVFQVVLPGAFDEYFILHSQSPVMISANCPLVSVASALGSSSTWEPILPALTMMVSCSSALSW